MRPHLLLFLGLILPLLPAQDAADLLTRLGLDGFRIHPLVGGETASAGKEGFSFLAGGHLYGHPQAADEGLSPSLKGHLAEVRRPEDRFFISLGDLVYRPDGKSLRRAKEVLLRSGLPVFNAPGNHEWRRGVYAREVAEDYGCFTVGSNLMIVLNTEITPWFIQDRQLEMLRRAAEGVARGVGVERIFVFSHKVVWAVGEERYRKLFEHVNGHDAFHGVSNYSRDVKPLIEEMARRVPVVFLSGDVGMPWSRTLFFDRPGRGRPVFACVGLGNGPEDLLLRVRVLSDGALRFEPVPLGAKAPRNVAEGGLDSWSRRFKESRPAKVLPPIRTSRELPGPIDVRLPDEERDGIPDAVVFRIPVRPGRVGRHHLKAEVRIADHPVVYSLRTEGFEAGGDERLVAEMRVPARIILSAGKDGPVMLLNLRLVKESGKDEGATAGIPLAAFSDYLRACDFSRPRLSGPELVLRGTRQEFRVHSPFDGGRAFQVLLSRAREPSQPLKAFDPEKKDRRLLPLAGDELFKATFKDGGGLIEPTRGVLDGEGEALFHLSLPKRFECPGGELFLVAVVFAPEAPLSIRAFSPVLRVRVR